MTNMTNSNQSYTGLVEKYIGSAYDTVKKVSDNIEEVIAVGAIDGIEEIVPNIAAAEEHANEAAQSAIEAAESALEADTIVSAFNDFYLGPYAVPPTVDNDGEPLLVGALYLDTAVSPNLMMYWDGADWKVSYATLTDLSHSDLIDLGTDDHTQYLTDVRHTAITGNPHLTSFLDLPDTPASLAGEASKLLVVSPDELSIAFTDISSVYLPISGGTLTGSLNVTGDVTSTLPPTSANHLTRKDYVDGFLPLTGGRLTGTLEAVHELRIIDDSGQSASGFSVWNEANTAIRAAFDCRAIDSALQLWSQGTGAQGSPDSKFELFEGKASLTAGNAHSSLATDPTHLTTKAFCDANYILSTGNATVSGTLTISDFFFAEKDIRVIAPVGYDERVGFSIEDANGDVEGAMSLLPITGKFEFLQRGAGIPGSPDTVLELEDGKARVWSGNAKPTTPTDSNHLTPKDYVDAQFSGISATFTTVDGKTVTVANGVIISVV